MKKAKSHLPNFNFTEKPILKQTFEKINEEPKEEIDPYQKLLDPLTQVDEEPFLKHLDGQLNTLANNKYDLKFYHDESSSDEQ